MPEGPDEQCDPVVRYIRELEREVSRLDAENQELKAAIIALSGTGLPGLADGKRKRPKLFFIPGGAIGVALVAAWKVLSRKSVLALGASAGILATGGTAALLVYSQPSHREARQPARHSRTIEHRPAPRRKRGVHHGGTRHPVISSPSPRPSPSSPAPGPSPVPTATPSPSPQPSPTASSPSPSPSPRCIVIAGVQVCYSSLPLTRHAGWPAAERIRLDMYDTLDRVLGRASQASLTGRRPPKGRRLTRTRSFLRSSAS